jgi:hypothetical protein
MGAVVTTLRFGTALAGRPEGTTRLGGYACYRALLPRHAVRCGTYEAAGVRRSRPAAYG